MKLALGFVAGVGATLTTIYFVASNADVIEAAMVAGVDALKRRTETAS